MLLGSRQDPLLESRCEVESVGEGEDGVAALDCHVLTITFTHALTLQQGQCGHGQPWQTVAAGTQTTVAVGLTGAADVWMTGAAWVWMNKAVSRVAHGYGTGWQSPTHTHT